MTALPDLLRRLRSERGWSQPQLARYSGVPQTTIAGLETPSLRRASDPRVSTLAKLAAALDVPVGDLVEAATKESESR